MPNYKLNSVEVKDYEMLKKNFATRKAGTCESVVNNGFLWSDYYEAKYYKNEYGIVFIYKVGDEVFSSSPLCREEDIEASVMDMKKYFNEVLGRELLMYVVDEKTADVLKKREDIFEITEERDYFDYVYDANGLRTLSGKKYHKKKNHLNAFIKNYEGRYTTRELKIEDEELITEFLDRWHKGRNIEDEYNRDVYEIAGIKRMLSELKPIWDKTNIKMFGVFVDERLEAFTLGTYLSDLKMVFVHVEKANPQIRGLYTFINKEFLCNCFEDALFVNREDDMGLEGLRQAKMTYNPVYFEKKYTVREKIKNEK